MNGSLLVASNRIRLDLLEEMLTDPWKLQLVMDDETLDNAG